MDLLLVPADPAFPTDDTPYFAGDERWDCSPFLAYADRSKLSTDASPASLDAEELYGFLQTWLFFGLVAEFLGLNEQEGGKHIIDPAQAKAELDALYQGSVVAKEDGNKYITGAKALDMVPLLQERLTTTAKFVGGFESRRTYLDDCLGLAEEYLDKLNIEGRFVFQIKYSLAALQEMISAACRVAIKKVDPVRSPKLKKYWPGAPEYINHFEAQMLAQGWCSNEIERIRAFPYGLHTTHYISRLKKSGPKRDHSRCHKYMCSACQIRKNEYEPAHVDQSCVCDFLGVHIGGVTDILHGTQSYPVLTGKLIWNENSGSNEAQVEAFEPGKPYVAISHVWADGLGHPTANALPTCQTERLLSLVASLQKEVDPDWEEQGHSPYRVWFDTLCCPVELNDKSIALQRIADVYRNAAHVLVLDASLTSFPSEGVEPAELLCRALSCSAWMCRLWTLQEGALSRSLHFQFADRTLTADVLLDQVDKASAKEARMTIVERDLTYRTRLFEELGTPTETLDSTQQPPSVLKELQVALIFRTVSVPSDEPLCIATLLGMANGLIANENGEHAAQKRMAILWKMIAEQFGIPPGLPLLVDDPLDIEGFRWAPKSLLPAGPPQYTADGTGDPHAGTRSLDLARNTIYRVVRFMVDHNPELAQLVSEGDRKGLRGSYPGFRVFARPHLGVSTVSTPYRLHPWDGVVQEPADWLFVKEAATGQWFGVLNDYCFELPPASVADEETLRLEPTGSPLCRAMQTGRCAIIKGNAPYDLDLMTLLQLEDETEFFVRRLCNITLEQLTEEGAIVADTMTELAAELAAEQVTADFIAMQDYKGSAEYTSAQAKLKVRMEELVAEAWKTRPGFANAAKIVGDSPERMWTDLATQFSHQLVLEKLPDDQIWLID